MMKKLTALLLCLVLIFALCACGKNAAEPETTAEVGGYDEPEEEIIGMQNPRTEYGSLDEINEIVGGNLMHPAVMGVTDNAYAVIDCGDYKIAEYQFTVAGYDYSFRCAKTTEDISGIYMEGGDTAFSYVRGEQDGIQFNADNEYKCARWFVNDDMQYVLSVNDKGEMEHDTFDGIADELMQMTLTYGE